MSSRRARDGKGRLPGRRILVGFRQMPARPCPLHPKCPHPQWPDTCQQQGTMLVLHQDGQVPRTDPSPSHGVCPRTIPIITDRTLRAPTVAVSSAPTGNSTPAGSPGRGRAPGGMSEVLPCSVSGAGLDALAAQHVRIQPLASGNKDTWVLAGPSGLPLNSNLE